MNPAMERAPTPVRQRASGAGGLVAPFVGIKLIDLVLVAAHLT